MLRGTLLCCAALCAAGDALPGLQHLTSLELSQGSTPQLSCLTNLEALCLDPADLERISAEMLGPLSRLTCLRILNSVDIGGYLEPSALAGKARLRHLQARRLFYAWDFGGAAETCTRAFLADLQQLQELTHLDLHGALRFNIGTTPAACYSTITASTNLEHLDICCNKFPPSVWGEIFPTSKRMPRLKVLKVSRAHSDDRQSAVGEEWQAADVVQVARCCPALLHLEADGMTYDPEPFAALTQYSGLQHLVLGQIRAEWPLWWNAFLQLQGLKHLEFNLHARKPGITDWECVLARADALAHLTAVTQLTRLHLRGDILQTFECKVSTRTALLHPCSVELCSHRLTTRDPTSQ